jgi:SAM-dependent methyltransferase
MGGASIEGGRKGSREKRRVSSELQQRRARVRTIPDSLAPYVQRPRTSSRARRDSARFDRVVGEVAQLAEEVASREMPEVEAIKAAIGKMPGRYTTNVNKVLFALWSADYDDHMAGHVTAIEHLIRKAVALQNIGQPVFGRRILDMTAGTGSVIDLICHATSAKQARETTFLTNDISPEMHEKLVAKVGRIQLARRPAIVQRSEDIRDLTLPIRTVNTAILSQTYHMITDPETPGPMNGSGNHHLAKSRVIESAFDILVDGGHFVLVDEWNPILTRKPGMEVIDALFHETFMPMYEKQGFIDMMKNVRAEGVKGGRVLAARLVAELKAWIDPVHRMYLFIYRKDPDKMYNRGKYVPDVPEYVNVREAAVEELLRRFRLADAEFVTSFAPDDTEEKRNLIQFEPFVNMKPNIVDRPKTEFMRGQTAIVLSRIVHDMNDNERFVMIENAVNALKKGGVLLLIDEFHHPMKTATESSKPHPWKKSALRAEMTRYENKVMFESALRVPLLDGHDSGMYGFMYRKL